MNAEKLGQALSGRPFRFFESTGSTNTDAKNWLEEEPTLASGALVVADAQTAGRGRFDRKWETPSGASIAMSVILRSERPAVLPMAAGLAVLNSVQSIADVPVSLKWPNDILIEGRKVGGILVEDGSAGGKTAYVVGIGLNVSVNFSASPLHDRATSLEDHTGSPVERAGLVAQIATRLETYADLDDVIDQWEDALSTIGRSVRLSNGSSIVTGLATSVDEHGRIGIQTAEGDVEYFSSGDVTML